jgi:tRNA(Ile)-lysidine synthase
VCHDVVALATRERMFRRVSKVLAAVSGGADSVAMLLVVLGLRERFGFDVEAVHFDHKLRPESATEMESVKALCKELGVECVTGEGDVAAVAARQRRGIEETARMMRYQFVAFVAEREHADCVATGHTADDQAETVLMRILRGSGIRGIRGMLPVTSVPGAGERRLVRPLLETSRRDTEAICREFGVTPISDPGNVDPAFTRSRVRGEVLHALRSVNPAVGDALRGLAASAREAFEHVERQSFAVQPRERGPVGAILSLDAFRQLPSEALTLVIEREAAFYHLSPAINRTRIGNLRGVLERGAGSVYFGDAMVEVSCGQVRIGPRLEPVEPFPAVILNVPGSTRAGPWRVDVLTAAPDDLAGTPVLAVGEGAAQGALRVRPLQPGDRLAWRGMVRKVSDLLVNEKVPAWERPGMVALADSTRVLGLFAATRVFPADMGGQPGLWVRLAAMSRP